MKTQKLLIKNPAVVYIDYGNVYGWNKGLSQPVNPKKLFKYLKTYSQISSINFYYGTDNNQKSIEFIEDIKKIGYQITTKPVKHITIAKIQGKSVEIRKCDFDIEICMDVLDNLKKNVNTFIFFSGDGDFAPLYHYLISLKKQVIVIYEQGHLGKEIWEIQTQLFKTRYSYLKIEAK